MFSRERSSSLETQFLGRGRYAGQRGRQQGRGSTLVREEANLLLWDFF